MKRLQMDEKQQKRIEAFFKEETTYFPDHVMNDYAYYGAVSVYYERGIIDSTLSQIP